MTPLAGESSDDVDLDAIFLAEKKPISSSFLSLVGPHIRCVEPPVFLLVLSKDYELFEEEEESPAQVGRNFFRA